MLAIQRLEYDKWVAVSVDELAVGDVITQHGKVVIVDGKLVRQDGKVIIPARPRISEDPIRIILGTGHGREGIVAAMDYVGGDLLEYEDGTAMIVNFEFGAEIYSPRLPVAELEAFCCLNMDRYEAFFEAHEESLDRAEVVPMERWW